MNSEMYLVLENGKVFKGNGFGDIKEVTAPVVFFTGAVGYNALLTDKSYKNKIVLATFPVLGNYGTISEDFESDGLTPAAYIVKRYCTTPSNFRSEGDVDTLFKNNGVTGLCNIDTRALAETLRENGVLNGCITANPESVDLAALKKLNVKCDLDEVSTKEVKLYGEANAVNIVIPDYGCKNSIINALTQCGCRVTLVPYNYTAQQIKALSPDGILLPGGPGNPNDYTQQIEIIKQLLKTNISIFGIGLGHQLLAIANGLEVTACGHGHHGSNQPVKCARNGRIYITYQSHSYAVNNSNLPQYAQQTFVNINDGTNEGLSYTNCHAASVQFYPSKSGGSNSTWFLIEQFIQMAKEEK